MTYAFIARACSDLPAAVCCRGMKVSTSGFYAWQAQPCSDRDLADAVLTNTIVDIHRMSRRSYGSPRVHAELRLGAGSSAGVAEASRRVQPPRRRRWMPARPTWRMSRSTRLRLQRSSSPRRSSACTRGEP